MDSAKRMNLLRRDDSTQRMPSRQHDPAMIHFRRRCLPSGSAQCGPLDQRPAARRTPVRLRVLTEHRMAMCTDPFHELSLSNGPLLQRAFARKTQIANIIVRVCFFYTSYIRESSPRFSVGPFFMCSAIAFAHLWIKSQSRISEAGAFLMGLPGSLIARLKGNGRCKR